MVTPLFNFRSYRQAVEIDGREYSLDCSEAAAAYIDKNSKSFTKAYALAGQGEDERNAALACARVTIERLLGVTESCEIFEGREDSLDDAADLLLFLVQTVTAYRKGE